MGILSSDGRTAGRVETFEDGLDVVVYTYEHTDGRSNTNAFRVPKYLIPMLRMLLKDYE